nr:YhjD/YihY/BrkB family envelope integrity protein [Leucobacter sp. wl10]
MIARAGALWQRAQRTRPVRTFSHFTDVGGSVLSGGMSYQALFAVFAGLWLGFGIFGIVLRGRPELLESLVTQINTFVPGLLGDGGDDAAAVQLTTLLRARSLDWTSLAAGLSLLWVALNWFTGTRRSIRIIFGLEVKQYRNPALLKLRDLALAACFFAAIIVSAALTVLSSNLTGTVLAWVGVDPENWFFGGVGVLLRYGAMFVFDLLILLAMHRFLAEVRVPRWRLLGGCALGGLALLGLKVLGGALLGGVSSNPLLASFAVLVGLLLWFNLLCRTLLLTSCWIVTGENRVLGLPERAAAA